MPDVQVQQTATLPSQDPARSGKMDVLVVYQMQGRMTPSTILLPEETFSEAVMLQRIRDTEARVGAHAGKTFSL